VINKDGWNRFNIWEHSQTVLELYERRCRKEVEEMTCHAQAAELLRSLVSPGDALLDVGCGSGCFFHSIKARQIPVDYFGIDPTSRFISLARKYLPLHGLDPTQLHELRIEDTRAEVDHVVCINVLSNIDNYHKPLERMLLAARKSVILRESCHAHASYAYVRDEFLDAGVLLNVHVNTYAIEDITDFIAKNGFDVRVVIDDRTKNEVEYVIGYPHYWKFLVCTRKVNES
jgi:SAM-dependent methyltransferase